MSTEEEKNEPSTSNKPKLTRRMFGLVSGAGAAIGAVNPANLVAGVAPQVIPKPS